jgi:hypothetical protein
MNGSKKRSIPIILISLFYILAAVSTIFCADAKDLLLTIISIIFYLTMGFGLWRLRRWARIAEIGVCYLQILAGFIIAALFQKTTLFASTQPFYHGWLWVLLAGLCVINMLIIKHLNNPEVRGRFS